MVRTIPTATTLVRMEIQEWKTYREYLSKKERAQFDEMLSLARKYGSAIMRGMPYVLVPIWLILMSIPFYHHKGLQKKH